MQKTVKRKRDLQAFSLSTDQLERLWSTLLSLFEEPESVRCDLMISLGDETLHFEQASEVASCNALPDSVTKFNITLEQKGRRIWIFASSSLKVIIEATGESVQWCAGAVEATYALIRKQRCWYHWFVGTPGGVVVLVLVYTVVVAPLWFINTLKHNVFAYLGWLGFVLVLALLYLLKGRLLPSATIRVRERGGFVHNHVAELALGVAILTLVFNVVARLTGS